MDTTSVLFIFVLAVFGELKNLMPRMNKTETPIMMKGTI